MAKAATDWFWTLNPTHDLTNGPGHARQLVLTAGTHAHTVCTGMHVP